MTGLESTCFTKRYSLQMYSHSVFMKSLVCWAWIRCIFFKFQDLNLWWVAMGKLKRKWVKFHQKTHVYRNTKSRALILVCEWKCFLSKKISVIFPKFLPGDNCTSVRRMGLYHPKFVFSVIYLFLTLTLRNHSGKSYKPTRFLKTF